MTILDKWLKGYGDEKGRGRRWWWLVKYAYFNASDTDPDDLSSLSLNPLIEYRLQIQSNIKIYIFSMVSNTDNSLFLLSSVSTKLSYKQTSTSYLTPRL